MNEDFIKWKIGYADEDVLKLEADYKEAIEALKEICSERNYYSYYQLEAIAIIEKATGKEWEDIIKW